MGAPHVELSDARDGCEQGVAVAVWGRVSALSVFVSAALVAFWFSKISATARPSAPAFDVIPAMN